MAKRIRYNIGDVFLMELEKGLKAVGRVIKKDGATVFLAIYRVKPFENNIEIDLNQLTEELILTMEWCYDKALKNGTWEVVGNIPVEENFEMPYFGTDSADGKYWIIKGGDTHSGQGTPIEVSKEESLNAYSYGISNEIALPKDCIYRFRKIGMI